MLHGLLWFPLLAIFIGLARAGWNEYQKLEVYRVWAESFDRAKYDIYAVLGQKGDNLIWGKPTRKGITDLHYCSRQQIQAIHLLVDGQTADLANPPARSRQSALELCLADDQRLQVPFTDLELTVKWGNFLTQEWLRSA
jgi:hypothetical protein